MKTSYGIILNYIYSNSNVIIRASLVAYSVRNPTANAGELGSIPGSEWSPGGGNATHSRFLTWEIPWTEELGGLQSIGSQELDMTTSNMNITLNFFVKFINLFSSSDVKESDCNAGDPDLIAGSGKSPGEGNGNLLLYSCLENPMNRGACWATVHGVSNSWIWLSD